MTGDDDGIRIGTPERERAVALLSDALAHGYLELAEFEQRSRQVYAARTRGELRAVLADLQGSEHVLPPAGAAVPAPVVVPAAALAPQTLDVNWTTVRRKGSWDVPPRLLVTGSMGTLELDLRRARLAAPTVEIELQVSASSVKLRLAPDHTLVTEALTTGTWSSVRDKAGPATTPAGPRVVLFGSLSGWSSVVVRRD